jgi:hypothetical protein
MYTHRKVRSPENAADARVYAQSERCRFFGNTILAEEQNLTHAAAELLGMSRLDLVQLLDAGKMPYRRDEWGINRAHKLDSIPIVASAANASASFNHVQSKVPRPQPSTVPPVSRAGVLPIGSERFTGGIQDHGPNPRGLPASILGVAKNNRSKSVCASNQRKRLNNQAVWSVISS